MLGIDVIVKLAGFELGKLEGQDGLVLFSSSLNLLVLIIVGGSGWASCDVCVLIQWHTTLRFDRKGENDAGSDLTATSLGYNGREDRAELHVRSQGTSIAGHRWYIASEGMSVMKVMGNVALYLPNNSSVGLLQEGLELISRLGGRTNAVETIWWWVEEASATSFHAAILELSGTELTSSSSLLLKHLLLVCVGVADLHDVFLTTLLRDRCVVECLDDFFADITRLETADVSDDQRRRIARLTEQNQHRGRCRCRHEEYEQSRP